MGIQGEALMVLTPLRPGQDEAGRLGHGQYYIAMQSGASERLLFNSYLR